MKINKNIFVTEIDDNLVILNTETGLYLELNGSASFIFKQIQELKTKEQIIDLLIEKYDIQKEEAESSILEFIEDANSKGILDCKRS